MTISETDLVFLQSERLDDTPQGGGRMTGTVVPDGQENNLFPDIAPTDRVFGRVRLRKVFAANRSTGVDSFLGAHVAISHRPADPAVDINLFAPGAWTDTRTEAREYLERFLTRGPYWNGQLYGDHLAGQRTVQLYQLLDTELPAVGQTLVLIADEGGETEQEQYIRITQVDGEVRTFVDQQGNFKRLVITLALSDPLRYDFQGTEPLRVTTGVPIYTRVRDTIAASAAHYYGARTLAQAALTGDRTIYVDQLYGQLVPSSQTETPMVDLDAAGTAAPLTVCGSALTLTTSAPLSPSNELYLGMGIIQGSLTITTGGTTLTDNGQGDLLSGATVVGVIDYSAGTVIGVDGGPTYSSSKSVVWTPAAAPAAVDHSAGIGVSAESRGYNWTITLAPVPRPGTLRVDYQVAGKWYRLADRGDGGLTGATAAHGAGSLNFATGSVLVTCGALPDVGSEILFFWSAAADAVDQSEETFTPPEIAATLAHGNVVPNTVELSWTTGGVAKTASDDGAGGLTGDATGTIDYSTGAVILIPTLLPAVGVEISADYQYGPPRSTTVINPTRSQDGSITITAPHQNLVPGTVQVVWNRILDPSGVPWYARRSGIVFDQYQTASDDGAGNLPITGGTPGSVSYAAGSVTFIPSALIDAAAPEYRVVNLGTTLVDGEYYPNYRAVPVNYAEAIQVPAGLPTGPTGQVTLRYRISGSEGTVSGETLTITALQVRLPKNYEQGVVPGSARFTVGGRTYVDRIGVLYYAIDPATGAGTLGGAIDYGSGIATLSAWAGAVAPAQTLHALAVQANLAFSDETCLRCAISPVRPGSFTIRATPMLDGASPIEITATNVGAITQPGIAEGLINYQTGVARIRWGGWVADEPLTPEEKAEPWYDANAVVRINNVDMIFKPYPIVSATVRYSAVGYSYLPLDATLLGIDPVRLPSDGRVQVLSVGDMVLIMEHHSVTVQSPQAGGTVDTERTGVARVRVFDANGLAVPPSRYSLAQDTGLVTWANPLDLSGYTAPYTVEATIEDAALIIEADLSGRLTLNRVLTHNYPEDAIVASAYLFGDLFAQASTPFSQQAWTNVWSDERIGSPILAQYNSLLYPMELDNASSWRERWALIFTNSTSFRVIGETLGDITDSLGGAGYHDVDHDLAPINPITSTPYFTLPWEGWGSGWVTGNVLRFNLLPPANFPLWIAMTVQPSAPTTGQDQFRLLLRGGIDV